MDSVDSSDNDKELAAATRGKGFKSPGKLFIKKNTGDEATETAGS